MKTCNNISKSIKTNFCVNLLNIIPFLFLIISGSILQIEFHLLKLPNDYLIANLNRADWLVLHKISATISFMGVIIHCILHWNVIIINSSILFVKKTIKRIPLSYYLFLVAIPTTFTAMFSWVFIHSKSNNRTIFIEIHDKIALIVIILSIIHILSRLKWMLNIIKRIRTVESS